MKTFIICIFLFAVSYVKGQYPNNFECTSSLTPHTNANSNVGTPFEGLYKPTRSDRSNGNTISNGFFPVLIVFVEFPNDPSIIEWDAQQPPDYIDNMISITNNSISNGEWWNTYSQTTATISDHYMEISRGHLELISPSPTGDGSFHVVLPYTAQEYYERANYNYAAAELLINADIWDDIKSQGLTDWRPYDQWGKNDTTNLFEFSPDGYVDMIYKIHKTKGAIIDTSNNSKTLLIGFSGYAYLSWHNTGTEITIDQHGTKINYGFWHKGSGITMSYSDTKTGYVGGTGHEHMHFMLSDGHRKYSRVSYGIGFENFFSPFDMVAMDYMDDIEFNVSTTVNYSLGGYASRNGSQTGNILRIPIFGTNEFFILVNRNKESYWDRVMLGDTAGAQFSTFELTNDYGKGLYIYHTANDYSITGYDFRDMECADGYFEWQLAGWDYRTLAPTCFQSGNTWRHYTKKKALYTNDPSAIDNTNPIGDGISLHHRTHFKIPGIQGDSVWTKWWDIGKREATACVLGTDKYWVNEQQLWSKNENAGDRWDAWKPGYNELFSPYSSPSTAEWDDQSSGIFIWFYGNSNGDALLKIYRDGSNGMDEDSILHLTPPSRPMMLRDTVCEYSFGQFRPKILWTHNMEPDMNRMVGESEPPVYEKRYMIYRSVSTNLTNVPNENAYTNIATVNINSSVNPYYIDTSAISGCYLPQGSCPPNCWVEYRIRYRVTAVDKYDDESVKSDFAATTGIRTESGEPGGGEEDAPHISNLIPTEFALQQNYPNPFNPVTSIQYQLPKDVFVTIKLYDIAGREIAVLVNDFKQAGHYLISFNGTELSSGVYFYKITTGSFTEVKRMVLIK